MRILFLEQFGELGGGQRNLLDLLPAVRDEGSNALVGAPGDGPLLERVRAMGFEAAEIPLSRYADGHKTAADAARFPIDTLRLQRWIARMPADLISVGGPRLLMAASFGACGRSVIFQAQHFLNAENFSSQRALRMAGWAIRNAQMTVVANSGHVAEQYRKFANVRIVYNGVAEIPFARRKRDGEWRVGMIGRIAPMKGQTDFLRAAPAIPGARFIICGSPMFSPRAYVDEVHRLAEGLPVEFTGWRDDVGAVLGELDLMVVASTAQEATTRVILEAFSAGVPVVAYAAGGIPEILRDGENGFLARERSAEALAQRVREAMNSDLDRIARRARAEFEEKFTVRRYREEMLGMYRSAMHSLSAMKAAE
jgi:glycosyltransferase involved in cell wall biosynthesis